MEPKEVYHIDGTVKEVVITHRNGLDDTAPLNVVLHGTLENPANWLEARAAHVPFEDSYVEVVRKERTILLVTNATNKRKIAKILGNLELHPDLEKWQINKGNSFNHEELSEFVKMNRSCFSSKQEAMKLAGELKNLKMKVEKEAEMSNDNRGNVRVLAAQRVIDSTIPHSFRLKVPVFKGQPKVDFEVEVYVSPNNFGVTLVSPDLNDIIAETTDQLIDAQIARFNDLNSEKGPSNQIVILES